MLKNLRGGIDWHHLEKIVQECAILTKENNYEVRTTECKEYKEVDSLLPRTRQNVVKLAYSVIASCATLFLTTF